MNKQTKDSLKDFAIGAIGVALALAIHSAHANTVTGYQSTATGLDNVVSGNNAVAVGYNNRATGNESSVIGESAVASADNASAFGSKATATGESSLAMGSGSNATADSAVAIGNDSNATAKSSVALGESTNATGVFATALGDSSSALANGSVAISVDSKAQGINSMAIGRGAVTTHDNSVAIGAGAVSKLEQPINQATIGHTTYLGFAGNNPVATFSVGAEGAERQIVNVAAGEISATSTDAVNGSQLYAIAQSVENLATTIPSMCITMYSTDNNVNVEQTGEMEFDLTLNKDLSGLNTVTVNADNGNTTVISTDGMAITHYDNANSTEYNTVYNHKGVVIKTNDGDANPIDNVSLTIEGLNNGGKRAVNIDKGISGTDAVNVDQLNEALNHVDNRTYVNKQVGAINNRLDGVAGKVANNSRRIDQLSKDVAKNRKRADAGTAAVAAMANIPQVLQAGKAGVGVGVGFKHNQAAVAVGYSRASDNNKHIIKLSAGFDSQKDVTVGAGYMYQW